MVRSLGTAIAIAVTLLLLVAGTARASVTARHPARVVGDIPWNCTAPMNETACLKLTGCYWNVFQHNCQRICSLVSTAEPCSTEPGCRWLPTPSPSGSTSNGTCTTACMFAYQESTTCNAAVECTWDDQLSGCVGYCSFYEQLQQSQQLAEQLCKADTGCQWDGTAANKLQRCKPACRLAEIPEVCNSSAFAAECVWAPMIDMCVNRVSPPPEPTTAQPATTTPGPAVTCSSLSSADSCNGSPRCQWNSVYSICTPFCRVIEDFNTCTANPTCVFNNNQCVMRCNLFSSSSTTCETNLWCTWSYGMSTCVPKECASYQDSSSCADSGLCTWGGFSCVPTCKFYSTSSGCYGGYPGCFWDSDHDLCLLAPTTSAAPTVAPPAPTSCGEYSSQTPCNADEHCVWYGALSMCQRLCPVVPDSSACNAQPGCYWSGDSCVGRCELLYTEKAACNENSPCHWNRDENICEFQCSSANGDQCYSTGLCHWLPYHESCVSYCNVWGTPRECNSQGDCSWNNNTLHCDSA